MKIADALSEEALSHIARQTVEVGDVYRMEMTKANGITPKGGAISRNKYFVVLGFDDEGNVYGGVIINSEINKNLPVHIKIFHMPIYKAKYQWLDYNSFIDCLQLKKAFLQKFSEWQFMGKMDDYDVELIIGTIKESPRESVANIQKYGL